MLSGILVVAPIGCGKHGATDPGLIALSPNKVVLQRNVEVAVAQQRALVYRVETVGVLEGEGRTEIKAGVTGLVDEVFFREGDEVVPGTLLVTLDQEKYQADEALAKANVERAKAGLDMARDLSLRSERAGRNESEEERVKRRGQVKIAEAELRTMDAAYIRALHNLKRSQVRAPYFGRINKRMVTKGSYLEENTAIASMVDLSRMRLAGYVPETAAPTLRALLRAQDDRLDAARVGLVCQPAGPGLNPWSALVNGQLLARDFVLSGYDPEFELLAIRGEKFYGRIFFMSTEADPSTHMFEAKAEVLGWEPELARTPVSNTAAGLLVPKDQLLALPAAAEAKRSLRSKTTPKLYPGLTAKIWFPLKSTPGACVIPEEAARASERGYIVFVPTRQTREDGTEEWIARARTIVDGARADGWIEVRAGLAPGETIVRRGAEALEDGTPIRFKE